MSGFIPALLFVGLLVLLAAIFVASVKNARALKRDLDKRFDGVQVRLEQQANALADEILARTKDTPESP